MVWCTLSFNNWQHCREFEFNKRPKNEICNLLFALYVSLSLSPSLSPSGSFVAIIHLCLFVLTLIEYSFITLNSQLFFTINGKTNAFSGRDMTTIISHRDKDRDSLRERVPYRVENFWRKICMSRVNKLVGLRNLNQFSQELRMKAENRLRPSRQIN